MSNNNSEGSDNSNKDLLISRWNELSPEEVLSDAFHEIRNPIYQIVGFISMLKDTNLSSDEISRIVNNLFDQAIHSKNIVDSVYDYINTKQK